MLHAGYVLKLTFKKDFLQYGCTQVLLKVKCTPIIGFRLEISYLAKFSWLLLTSQMYSPYTNQMSNYRFRETVICVAENRRCVY